MASPNNLKYVDCLWSINTEGHLLVLAPTPANAAALEANLGVDHAVVVLGIVEKVSSKAKERRPVPGKDKLTKQVDVIIFQTMDHKCWGVQPQNVSYRQEFFDIERKESAHEVIMHAANNKGVNAKTMASTHTRTLFGCECVGKTQWLSHNARTHSQNPL